MFSKINVRRLRNAELIEYLTQLLETVNTGFGPTPLPPTLALYKANLTTAVAGLNDLHVLDPASRLTGELDDLDEQRDSLLVGLSLLCQSYTHHPDESVKAAALVLDRHMSVYGSVSELTVQSRAAETTTIESILSDWSDKRDLNAAATALPVSPFTRAIKTVNDAFREKSIERDAEAGSSLHVSMSLKRIEAGTAYADLLTMLNSHYHVSEGTQPWAGIAAGMNALTERFADMLAVRAGRAKVSKAKEAAK
jgi:hypothetical protein